MSSQKQSHRVRRLREDNWMAFKQCEYLRERNAWLERRPPWWKFWAVRKWKEEEPK